MTEPKGTAKHEDAMLQLLVELRKVSLAQEEAQPGQLAPPRGAPKSRVRLAAAILLGFGGGVALAYLISIIWPHPVEVLPLPAPAQVHTAAPSRIAVAPPSPLPGAAHTPAAASSEPARPTVPRQATPAAQKIGEARGTIVLAERPAGYRVQVGAFNVLEYAQDLMRQLRAHDYSVTLVEVRSGPPHRVWIDGVFDQVAAERLVNQLRRDGFEAVFVPE